MATDGNTEKVATAPAVRGENIARVGVGRTGSKSEFHMYPNSELRKPVRRYADTFSAVTLLKQMFRLSR